MIVSCVWLLREFAKERMGSIFSQFFPRECNLLAENKDLFQTAYALAQQQQNHMNCITSGIKLVDELVGGGYERGLSYLIYGSAFCTKMLLRSIATALRLTAPEEGTVVIDGNNGIRPNVLLNHLKTEGKPKPPTVFLDKLHVARAFTTDQLLTLLFEAPTLIQDAHAPILFVNGITHLLQEEEDTLHKNNEATSNETNPLIFRRSQVAALLKRLAFSQHIAVIASADAPKRANSPTLRIGQAAHHSFHILIHHKRINNVDTFTLMKHPSRPWQQLSTVISKNRRSSSKSTISYPSFQTTLD